MISSAFKTLSPVLRLSSQSINNNIINSIDKIVVIKIASTSLNIRHVKDLDA